MQSRLIDRTDATGKARGINQAHTSRMMEKPFAVLLDCAGRKSGKVFQDLSWFSVKYRAETAGLPVCGTRHSPELLAITKLSLFNRDRRQHATR